MKPRQRFVDCTARLWGTKLTPGKWITARASYDGQALKIFIDGKEDASAAIQTKKLASSDDIIIGKRFGGRIADVAIAVE